MELVISMIIAPLLTAVFSKKSFPSELKGAIMLLVAFILSAAQTYMTNPSSFTLDNIFVNFGVIAGGAQVLYMTLLKNVASKIQDNVGNVDDKTGEPSSGVDVSS